MDVEQIKEFAQIRKHFTFLFDEGYSVCYIEPAKSFNNWLVDLKSDKYRIQFCEDRGELDIRMGPRNASTGWRGKPLYQISLLIFYVTDGKSWIGWHRSDEDFQKASEIFRKYQPQFEEILTEENLPKHEEKLRYALQTLTKLIIDSIHSS